MGVEEDTLCERSEILRMEDNCPLFEDSSPLEARIVNYGEQDMIQDVEVVMVKDSDPAQLGHPQRKLSREYSQELCLILSAPV